MQLAKASIFYYEAGKYLNSEARGDSRRMISGTLWTLRDDSSRNNEGESKTKTQMRTNNELKQMVFVAAEKMLHNVMKLDVITS